MASFPMRRVIGVGLDGSSVTTTLGKIEVPLIKAGYGDKLETSFSSYMGSQEQDEQSPGSYKTDDLKMTMTAVIFRTIIMPAFPNNGAGLVKIAIVIGRSHPELGSDSDLLIDCRCMNFTGAVESSNKVEEVELTWTVRQIKWTRARKTINQIRNGGAVGVSKF